MYCKCFTNICKYLYIFNVDIIYDHITSFANVKNIFRNLSSICDGVFC